MRMRPRRREIAIKYNTFKLLKQHSAGNTGTMLQYFSFINIDIFKSSVYLWKNKSKLFLKDFVYGLHIREFH